MFCTAVSTSLSGVWGQQLLPKCICAKACQPALPAHSKGQSVSGGAPVGGCKVRMVGGWPGWSFLTWEPASQQDQTGCRVNHYPSHHLTKSARASMQPLLLSLQLRRNLGWDKSYKNWLLLSQSSYDTVLKKRENSKLETIKGIILTTGWCMSYKKKRVSFKYLAVLLKNLYQQST